MRRLKMIDKLNGIICSYTSDESLKISGDTVLLTDLGLNSYELVELVCEVEESFGVNIPDTVITGFKTVQDIIDYLASKA